MLIGSLVIVALAIPCFYAQEDCWYVNENMPKGARTDLYRGQQAFTIDLLKAIETATPNENVFFSPYSTYHALLLAYFGARGNTEEELKKALHLDWTKNKNAVNSAYKIEKRQRMKKSSSTLHFSSADKIFFDRDVKVGACLADVFVDEIETLNFRQETEKSRGYINEWIANTTNNEIQEMLSPGDITTDTQLLLANAAYFKGEWSSQFDPKDTNLQVFYTSTSKFSYVDMMHKRGSYNFAVDEYLGAHVLEMPYLTSKNSEQKSPEISMLIILPPYVENSIESVLNKLNADALERVINEMMAREVDVSVPKFEFEQNIELMPILRKIGINEIFEPKANLTTFTAQEGIHFGDAKHVAKIKVDEEGSSAAAATVLFSFRSARPLEPSIFNCNHPFIFLIYDHNAKAVLFTGIYRDPGTRN